MFAFFFLIDQVRWKFLLLDSVIAWHAELLLKLVLGWSQYGLAYVLLEDFP